MKISPIAIAAVVLILILSVPIPRGQSRLTVELLDAGHAPLFGIAALFLLLTVPRARKGTPREYLFALLIATLIGILTEFAQWVEGGDAELNDMVADFLGAASFLALHWTVYRRSGAGFKWFLRLAAVACLVVVFRPPVLSGMAILHRNATFPVLLDFDSTWDSRSYRWDEAKCEIVPAPSATGKGSGDRMGRVTFEPVRISAFVIEEPYPDWRGYRQFAFTVYSELAAEVSLRLRIDTSPANASPADHFDMPITIPPGIHKVLVPLVTAEGKPTVRGMDMAAIHRIILLASQPPASFSLYLDDFHLE